MQRTTAGRELSELWLNKAAPWLPLSDIRSGVVERHTACSCSNRSISIRASSPYIAFDFPAQTVRHARQVVLHLPAHAPWTQLVLDGPSRLRALATPG